MHLPRLPVLLCALAFASCSVPKSKVDLVLLHGRFDTLDRQLSGAQAVAVRDGKIVGVGTDNAVRKRFTASATIDLEGAFVLPGLIDGHAHMVSLGVSLSTLDLTGARSAEGVSRLVAAFAAKCAPGSWIRGGGWSPAIWPGVNFRANVFLDKVAQNNFVFLVSSDGQAAWVNSRVLKLANITRSTPNPNGGTVVKDRSGNPTGILVGSAMDLVASRMPPPSESEIENAIILASDTCARYGITEVQDAGIDVSTLKAYEQLAREHELKIRIYAMYDGNDTTLPGVLRGGPIKDEGGFFSMRSVRVDMDGPLRSRGAALVHAYSDDPGSYGITLMGEKDLENLSVASLSSGFQVCTEAHGDRGVDIALDAYQRALKVADVDDPRLRIEGAEIVLPGDIDRFSKLGVIPSMQPGKFISDIYWIESLIGPDRARYFGAWSSLIKSGSVIIGGSDFPFVSPDPRIGIYSAITRQSTTGFPRSFEDARTEFSLSPDAVLDSSDFRGGFFASQRMTADEAIRAFVSWPAYGAFQENRKGSTSVGKDADFTIFSEDMRALPARRILSDQVLGTIVGGRLAYASPLWKQDSVSSTKE